MNRDRFLVVADLAQIEARALVWLAGQLDILEAFYKLDEAVAAGAPPEVVKELDIYTITGRKMGMDRQGGKVGVLSGGYGSGRFSIQIQARNYKLFLTEDEAQNLVDAYRSANPMVVQMWKEEDDASKAAIQDPGTVIDRGRTGSVMFNGMHLIRKLPSGRCLNYRNARIEKRMTPWGQMRWTIVHDANYFAKGSRDFVRLKMHGALGVQNVTQAMCRDILATGMLRAEDAGLEIVLHVHDELGIESEEPDRDGPVLIKAMTDPIEWCPGLPISSSVDVLKRYKKA